jgi:localization factor PodJL
MSLPSPWSVKGVQPKTREAAKDLARREGLTLGEWLNRLIGDVDEDGNIDTPRETPQSSGTPVQPQRSQQVFSQPTPPSFQQTSREELPLAPFPSTARTTQGDNENSRLTAALEQLTRRLDAAMGPTETSPPPVAQTPFYEPHPMRQRYAPETIAEPFGSADLMDRLEATERRAETALGRVDASLSDVRQTQAALAERLRIMEANDPSNKSLSALRGLENALNRLSEQVFETQSKAEELDHNYNQISQRLENTEAIAGETRGRLSEAMVDLSARLTGVEQNQDDPRLQSQVNGFGERLAGIEDITTQAIESVDKGLGLVSQRVAATEALANATNERLVEALIDLSARMVQLENIDSQEQAREMLSAIEAKNKELTRRLEVLDNKIDTTRGELTHEVKSALATGVDGRMADIAKALADRLDMSERRSGEALEKIGAEMARASISLDQRLRDIEDRGTDDIAVAMRNEMAKMARSIDERMASMEQRDAAAMDQAGGHIKELARSLNDRLDASEERATTAVQNVSSQMEQLALRLQARQDETAKNLVARMEDGEARSHQDLKSSMENLATEIRASEDRAKAVVAPLHRDFNAMVDRLDQVETSSIAPYAETVSFGEQAVTLGNTGDYQSQNAPYDSAARTPSFETSLGDEFAPLSDPQNQNGQNQTRRPGFGSPFPGTGATHESETEFSAFDTDSEINSPLSDGHAFDEFDEGPLLSGGTPSRADTNFEDDTGFVGDLDATWEQQSSRTNRGSADYLANARLAASRAAAARAEAQPSKKSKPLLGAAKKKQPKSAMGSTITDISGQTTKAKPILSPVGMVAAATLVVATGVIGINYLSKDKSQDEKPNALQVTPAAPAPNASTSAPTNALVPPEQVVAPDAGNAPVAQTPVAQTPAAQTPVVQPSTGPTQDVYTPPKQTVAPPPATSVETPPKATSRPQVKPSAQAREFQAAENARASQALARSEAAKARLKAVAPSSAPRQAAQPQVMANLTPLPVPVAPSARVPASAPSAQPANPTRVAPPRIATPQIAVATPNQRPAPFGTPAAQQRPAPAPTARTQAARTPTPRIAAANPTGPVTAANVRQVFDQAMAKQQAGDLAGAAALMRAAADTGDARSIQRLAKMYERGEGVPRDPAQARQLTERAATRGNSQAMHNMGVYYAEGEGAARDLNKAAENFRRAANRGVTDSQFNLGAMAEQGMGGPKSEREAYYWYSVAGRNGDRDAASKARELAARLPAAERTAEDQRVAQFRAEASSGD